MENQQATIEQTTKELLEAMGFETTIGVDLSDETNMVVNVQTDEAGFLIGQAGANLQALQHLCRLLVNKKVNAISQDKEQVQVPYFMIDVNNYKKHRVDLLKELAQNMAEQALSDKAPLFLQPMPAYERRIIHISLVDNEQIDTESVGEGENRRVIIRPKP